MFCRLDTLLKDAKKVVFRCEASPFIGAGHVLRCISLAESLELRGWKCFFVATNETFNFIPLLQKFRFLELESFDKDPFLYQWLIVDNYDLVILPLDKICQHSQKIMVIEDHANRHHHCDLLVDQMFWHKEEDYAYLVPKTCRLLIGSTYTIIRKEFLDNKATILEKRKYTKKIKHILINFGGGNQYDFVLSALNSIKNTSFDGDISIVFGFAAIDAQIINNFRTSNKNGNLFIYQSTSMVERIAEADLAIGSPAGSFLERCVLGLPSIMYDIVPNQRAVSGALRDKNCPGAIVVDDLGSSLEKAIENCINSDYQVMSQSVFSFCNEKGVDCIIQEMEKEVI